MMADGLSIRKHPYDPIENGSLTSAQYVEFLFQLFELFGDVQLEECAIRAMASWVPMRTVGPGLLVWVREA